MPRERCPMFGYNLYRDGKLSLSSPGNYETREEAQRSLDYMLAEAGKRETVYTGELTEGEWVEYDDDWAYRIVRKLSEIDEIRWNDVEVRALVEDAKLFVKELPWVGL